MGRQGLSVPAPPELRRKRRAKVERLMMKCRAYMDVVDQVSREFEVTPRTVWRDVRLIREKWHKAESKMRAERRERVIRTLEKIMVRNVKKKNDREASDAAFKLARVLGMGIQNQTVNVDNRRGVFINVERMPQGDDEQQQWLDEYVACRDEYRGRLPEVVDVEAHERNGDGGT